MIGVMTVLTFINNTQFFKYISIWFLYLYF